jgi:ubiquinone/menaquinone biosynthesis C-methylase UbiE
MASGCFDLLAADYDRTWTNSNAGRLQRDAVWAHLRSLFHAGDSVLDLGCGTGEDASYLGGLGVRVSAIDASPAMVRIAQSRGVAAKVGSIEGIQTLENGLDGVLSNFGALNCVEHLSLLRSPLARLIRSGGHLAICLMGRFYLGESMRFARKLQLQKATRRWSGRAYSQHLDLPVYYPSASTVTRAFAPEFGLVRRVGIGLGSSQMCARVSGWPVLRAMADHQLFIFRRQ